MRVLFISVSGGLGGAERALIDMVAALRASEPGWKVAVLSLEDGPLGGELAALGVCFDVLALPPRFASLGESGQSPVTTAARLAASALEIRAYARRFRAAIERQNPDVVHSNGLKSHVLTAWTVRPPRVLVWHMHDFVAQRQLSAWLLGRNARRATAIVANSRTVAEDVRRAVGPRPEIETIHNGVDTARFTPEGPALDLDAASGLAPAPAATVRVGLVATYARWKGHEVFLGALAKLPRDLAIRGYIVGGALYQTTGSQRSRDELEATARSLGLDGRVGFVGFQQDTAPVYRALDVVVHASTLPEPFGLAIVEAMACGRATVISDGGGASEIARECENAPVYRPGDADELAAVLRRLCADADLRAALGVRGRATATRLYSRDRMGAEVARLYRRISTTPVPLGAV